MENPFPGENDWGGFNQVSTLPSPTIESGNHDSSAQSIVFQMFDRPLSTGPRSDPLLQVYGNPHEPKTLKENDATQELEWHSSTT